VITPTHTATHTDTHKPTHVCDSTAYCDLAITQGTNAVNQVMPHDFGEGIDTRRRPSEHKEVNDRGAVVG
jgi:hypothetical protein